ncbi:MAG TPA: transketolase C-terminal domain-containing protein [Nitrososphaerales archaeon]|nr:transketolase C-terminal domain-containing protein [Nitrososphaerales archaeon]
MTAAPEIKFRDRESWHLGTISNLTRSFVAGQVLSDIADKDDRIVILNADLGHANRTIEFAERHPERYFNMGIAEHNMVSAAAGLASTGFIPYIGTFASFLGILCCEQIRTDLAYPNMPVRLLSHHAGISLGYYGTSHHATEDIGIMRSMANMKIVCPADAYSLEQALQQTVDLEGPIYFRLSGGDDPDVYRPGDEWKYGKIQILREGKDATILANGMMVHPSLEASKKLYESGIDVGVADVHTVMPLDGTTLKSILDKTPIIFVAEDHNTRSGVATAIADVIVDSRINGIKLVRIGFPSDEYAIIGAPYHLYQHYGLTTAGLEARVRKELSLRLK